jgi:hypothetical protein
MSLTPPTPSAYLGQQGVDAKFRITRLNGWAHYRVVLDGADIAALGRGGSVEMEVASGAHTIQLLSRFGLGSPVETFSVRAGETAAFACRPRPFHRGSWIALERTGHRGATDPDQGLIMQITAAQANQPGIRR